MPKLSPQEQKKRKALKEKAQELAKAGYSIRAIGGLVQMSKSWVGKAIKESNPQDTLDTQGTD